MTKKSEFAYVTYISAAPEKVWNAVVDGEVAKHYWGHRTESDWKSGSPWRLRRADGSGIAKVTEIKGSHLVYVSQPDAVARVIESAARSIGDTTAKSR